MAANPPVHAGHSICCWRAAGALGGAAAGVGVVMTDASEALARALMESGVFYDGVQRRLEQSLAEQGFALVPVEPTEEMQIAWCQVGNETDWRERVPLAGTGQGDLKIVARHEDTWETFDNWRRYKAMIKAAQGKADG